MEGLPPCGHSGDYGVPQAFGSPYLTTATPYDQWSTSVVPVPSTVTVNSVESSPGASGHGDDLTPAYAPASMPAIDGTVVAGNPTSATNLDAAKSEYREVDAGVDMAGHKSLPTLRGLASTNGRRPPEGSSTNTCPSHNTQQHLSTYLHEPPWVYPAGTYYPTH